MGKGDDPGETKEAWDSNAITPGTPFMDLLAASLRYWVVQKLNTDPGWKGVRCSFMSLINVCSDPRHSSKSTYLMLAFRERVSTRSWTSSAASG
jgi:hypothetical protein